MTRTFRLLLAALAVLVLSFGLAACGGDEESSSEPAASGGGEKATALEKNPDAAGAGTITVGSKNFPEQYILGEIYAQTLEATGFTVRKRLNLGSEQVAYKALRAGRVDAYPEYTGTSLTSFFDVKTADVPKEPDAAYEMAKEEYAKVGITALPRTPFENTYILASSKETAEANGNPKTISELMAKKPDLSLSGFPECRQRTDCLLGMKDLYGYKGKFVSSEAKFEDIDSKAADLSLVFSTDPELALGKYATYEDDKGLFPPYNISLGIREETAQKIGQQGIDNLNAVSKGLTAEAMQELNRRVILRKQEPEAVAAAYLKESGFVQ